MKKLFCAFAALAIAAGVVVAQDTPTLSQRFKPGDPLHFLVKFEGKPELNGLSLYFRLQDPLKKDQAGFTTQFQINQFKTLSTGGFEVNGEVPKQVATGTWRVFTVQAAHDPATRSYDQGEFPKVTIDVVNDAGYEFPPLKSITPTM